MSEVEHKPKYLVKTRILEYSSDKDPKTDSPDRIVYEDEKEVSYNGTN